jgi:xanthine dehydrogenase molybdopterin-binding subunit B
VCGAWTSCTTWANSLNPGIDRGQIEGGFVQGMGWLTSEDLKWDAKGRLLTHSASTYQIPAISDAPMEFNVTLLSNATQPNTIHGSKAVGEPPLMLAFSVREALRDAVASFGAPGGQVRVGIAGDGRGGVGGDSGTGVRPPRLAVVWERGDRPRR